MVCKTIGIEEHFVTVNIRVAWAASPIGQEGAGGFDRREIEERLDDLGSSGWRSWMRAG
jgi:hypothetical protein